MDEAELERLVVRLVGDGSSYQQMMETAQVQSRTTAEHVTQAGHQIENIGQSLQSFASNAMQALSAFGAEEILRKSFDAFEKLEERQIRMDAVLRSNNRNVESTRAEYLAFAKDIERVSTSSVGSTMSLLRQAETFDLTGAAAERAAQNAISLAAVNDGSAESYIRLTAAMEEGDIKKAMRFARMIPQLRGIKDETLFLARAQQLFNTGQETSLGLSNTVSNQLERLERSVKALYMEMGKTVSQVMRPFVDVLSQATIWLKSLDSSIKSTVVITLMLAAAALIAKPAWMALGYTMGVVLSPMVIIVTALGTATGIWVARVGGMEAAISKVKGVLVDFINDHKDLLVWSALLAAVVLGLIATYKVLVFTVLLVHGVLTTLKIYKIIGIAAWLLYKAAVLAATVVMMAFNVSTGLGIVTLIAFAGALLIVGTAGYALWMTVMGLWQVLSNLPTTYGPILHISGLFREWSSILQDVVKAAKRDLPLAWQILQAGFVLAWTQIKSLWPPLWTFIKDGFVVLWDFAADTFIRKFRYGLELARIEHRIWTRDLLGLDNELNRMRLRVTQENERAANNLRVTEAEIALERIAGRFSVVESAETRAARAEVDRLRALIPLEEQVTRNQGQNRREMEGTAKAAQKFDQALYHSAEAITRMQQHMDLVAFTPSASSSSPTARQQTSNNDNRQQTIVERLTDIREAVQHIAATPQIVLEGLGLS